MLELYLTLVLESYHELSVISSNFNTSKILEKLIAKDTRSTIAPC